MKVVYIGQYGAGSTSGMRGEHLRKLLQPEKFIVANISDPDMSTNRIFRSIGWNYFKGPLIRNINAYCYNLLAHENDIDLVWVDKGVFITPGLIKMLRDRTSKLIHYTPDTAFLLNRSPLFLKAIQDYDFCITTKSFEMDDYKKAGAKNILFCTQGYDPDIHKHSGAIKGKSGVAFAGLCEPYREEVMARLLEAGIQLKIAGVGWSRFVKKYRANNNLQFLGTGLFGRDYSTFYTESQIGLGLLSKKFPELHTTRLFEIPACGTALVTERNTETTGFFTEEEVIFYNDLKELVERIQYSLVHPDELAGITQKGNEKVRTGGFDYSGILRSLLKQIGALS
jgi:spore maturation protein CgeB